MRAHRFSCNCKVKFQLVGIAAGTSPKYCPYCGKECMAEPFKGMTQLIRK